MGSLERATLAEIGKRLGRKVLTEVACVSKPDTILAWYRRLVAKKFDGSNIRAVPRFDRSSKHWWCEWHGSTRAGATIVSSVLSPTWAIICRIKLLEIFCAVTGLPRRRSEAEPPYGRTLSPRIRTFWRVLTSLPWKCSPCEDWSPTTFCSSFIWRAVASASPVSPDTRIRSGWNKSPAARPRRPGDIFIHAATFCMIATRSSVRRFDRRWRMAE